MSANKTKRPNISVLIPNYLGHQLLEKNLGSVMALLEAGDELLIIDDASPDQEESFNYLSKIFVLKLAEKNLSRTVYRANKNSVNFSLVLNKQNLRFGQVVNYGFKIVQNKLVFLLNNDVRPEKNVLDFLLPYFKQKDTFAVTCLEKNGPEKDDWSGKNRLWFEKGLFQHAKVNDFEPGENAWASGGSSLIDRDKFLALGGFDPRYKPAYWEDIDLSFQAKKRAWKIYFEPKAVIEHRHETTNDSVFGQKKIQQMSWRNGQKFTRKNANFRQFISYLFWRPYWLVKRIPFIIASL